MEVYTTKTAAITTDDRQMRVLDIVRYKNDAWLVAEWATGEADDDRKPKRLIRLATLRYTRGPKTIADIMVNTVIPAAVLSGAQAPAEGSPFEVVEDPEWTVPGKDEATIH